MACRTTPRMIVPAGRTRPDAAASTVTTADTTSPAWDVADDTLLVNRTCNMEPAGRTAVCEMAAPVSGGIVDAGTT